MLHSIFEKHKLCSNCTKSLLIVNYQQKQWGFCDRTTFCYLASPFFLQHYNTAFTLKQIYTDSKYIRIHIKMIKLKTDKHIYVYNCLHQKPNPNKLAFSNYPFTLKMMVFIQNVSKIVSCGFFCICFSIKSEIKRLLRKNTFLIWKLLRKREKFAVALIVVSKNAS